MTSSYPFVSKLFTMLNETENAPFISWGPEGGSFFVWNPTEFSSTVLPKYFKHNNFCSFVRQLNIYGFHKVENENWMFTHDDKLFQRDTPELISKIQRRRQSKRSGASNADESDDFISQQSMPKKMKSEESFATPIMTPLPPVTVATLSAGPLSPHPSTSVVSASRGETSPSSTSTSVYTPVSLHASSHLITSPMSSAASTSSSIEEDVAYLKSMNNVLLTELTQMKRRTQTQEETISWLIQELARTQRHVEIMSQHHLAEKIKTEMQSPVSYDSNTTPPPGVYHQSGGLPTPMQMQGSNANIINLSSGSIANLSNGRQQLLQNSNNAVSNMIYTPHSASSTSTTPYTYEGANLSASGNMAADYSDYTVDELSLYPADGNLM